MQAVSVQPQQRIVVPPEFARRTEQYLKRHGYVNPEDTDPATREWVNAFTEDMFYKLYLSDASEDSLVLKPWSEPQRQALETLADELYFGGRAGCGKTFLLLLAGCTEHHRTMIYRREYTQLSDIIDKSREILGETDASFNGNDKVWRDIPGGRQIEFGACKFDSDVDKFRGREYDLIAFDEVATFTEKQYLSLSAWARTIRPNQRVRIIGAGNPPLTSEYFWVKKRWAAWLDDKHTNPAAPGEIRWYARIDDEDVEVDGPEPIQHGKELIEPLSRTFIPGVMLDELKDEYTKRLQQTPEPLRSQLLYGDFSIAESDKERQLIPTAWVRLANERWEAMEKPEDVPLRNLAVDVARGGEDQTVISKRWDNWFAPLIKYSGKETPTGKEVAGVVLDNMEDTDWTDATKKIPIVLDMSGVGSSPYDILIENNFTVDGFISSSGSNFMDKSGQFKFANRRAEAWWKFMEALDPDSGKDLALPPDNELMADLTAPVWDLGTRGLIIESKDQIKKRIGRSPDCGDAVVMNYNYDLHADIQYF